MEEKVTKTCKTEQVYSYLMDAIEMAINIDNLSREIFAAFVGHIVVFERERSKAKYTGVSQLS